MLPLRTLGRIPAILVLLSSMGFASLAFAQPVSETKSGPEATAPFSATVIALDGENLVLDVGKAQVRNGAVLTLYRAIEAKHPITGKVLRDRFPNGHVTIVQVGEALSLAAPVDKPPRAPIIGDKAEAEVEKVKPIVAEETKVCDARCEQVAAAQGTILEVFYKTLRRDPKERVAIMKEHLKKEPNSPYKTWLEAEIAYFSSARVEEREKALASESYEDVKTTLGRVGPLRKAQAGTPLAFGVFVLPETEVRSVLLHLRKDGEPTYETVRLSLDEKGQGTTFVAERFVQAPGFDYFVEAVLPNNRTFSVLGSQAAPQRCVVVDPPSKPRRGDLSRIRFVTEYVSFDGLSGRDHYWLGEGDFLLRLKQPVLEGVRLGYGHYRGEGGTLEDLDELKLAPRPAAFTYGYLELVLGLHELFAVMPRLEVGLGRPVDETSTDSKVRGGGQLRVRIGRANGTNLVLAGESTPEIGQRAFVGLTLGLVEKWPIAFEVHVTDQPVNTDELGVRAVFELGYRPTDIFSLAACASYQGRTIDHAGPGLGLATTFDW